MVASYVRALVEQTFRMTKLTSIGSRKRYRIDVYEGSVTGQKPPASKRIREMYGKYEPEIYKFYKSHTQSMTGEAGNEDKADKRGNMMSGLRFKLSVAAIALVPFAIWGFVHSLHSLGPKKPAPVAERSEGHVGQASSPVQQPPKPAGPQWSTAWRLSGRFSKGLDDYYLIDGDHGSRRVERHRCRKDEGGNVICTVDGELVADWTGPQPGFVESTLGHTVQGAPISN
jgi:zona occludens toxin